MKLKEYLKLTKLLTNTFSKEIGITPVSLSRYISGERMPEKNIVLKILKKLMDLFLQMIFIFLKKRRF